MNPLDLRGPEFLAFYVAYGAVVMLIALALRALLSRTGAVTAGAPGEGWYPKESDAYRLALLRGGRQEVIRTVLARLAAGGLIVVGDDEVSRMPAADTAEPKLDELERTALKGISGTHKMYLIFSTLEAVLADEIDKREESLRRDGLLRRPTELGPFSFLRSAAVVVICGMGLAKIGVALSRGRTNVWFLIILMALYALIAVALLKPPQATRAGANLLRWLRQSHAGLRSLVTGGRRTSAGEVGLAAAIYGFGALTAVHAAEALRRASSREPTHWNSGSGSSCGGGGGCGGGGCGGGGCGGGGCGGCGGS
ncbi:MAG: TIGR04222 domain-containing membrane protein [Gemmatimonadota bacterium]